MALTVAAVAALAGSVAAFSAHPDPLTIAIVSAIAMLVAWVYWTRLPREHYREYYRARFVPPAVAALGGYRYDPNGTMPRAWMTRSGLIPEHHIYLSQDFFSGERSGIAVQFVQAKLQRYGYYPGDHGLSQGAAPGLAFGGILVLLSLRKAFAGRTIIVPDRGPVLNLFAELPGELDIVPPGMKTAHGRYEIHSTRPDEARQLLSAAIVERLCALAGALGGRRMQLAFYDAQILMMVPLKSDIFRAPSIFRRPIAHVRDRGLSRTLRTIDEIVDTLKGQVADGS